MYLVPVPLDHHKRSSYRMYNRSYYNLRIQTGSSFPILVLHNLALHTSCIFMVVFIRWPFFFISSSYNIITIDYNLCLHLPADYRPHPLLATDMHELVRLRMLEQVIININDEGYTGTA